MQERRVYEMSTQDKLDAMKRFSMLGNLFADEAQYQRALNQYKRVSAVKACAFAKLKHDRYSSTLNIVSQIRTKRKMLYPICAF